MKVLLVEDEKRMAQALQELLRQEGYDVDWFDNGVLGLSALESEIYDLAILDVMLPKKSGFEVAREARAAGIVTPILMLTAKTDTGDKVIGLDSGADDYLTKPFVVQELLARLRALSRRGAVLASNELSYGDIELNPNTFTLICTATGESVKLSEKEFRALEYLIINGGQVLTREQLSAKIWGFDSDAEYNNVEVYMSFARKKLAFVGAKTEIKAVRGVGYELRYLDS